VGKSFLKSEGRFTRIQIEMFARERNCLLRAVSHFRSGLDFLLRIRPLYLNEKDRIIGLIRKVRRRFYLCRIKISQVDRVGSLPNLTA